MSAKQMKYWSMVALAALGLLAAPGEARADTLTDWYNWSGTQSLDHDRTVTRYIAVGYGSPATLNHTAGTLYHVNTAGDGFIIGNNVAGTYNMAGNAAVNAADGAGRFRLGNEGGQGTMTMTDNATATVGSLEFGGFFGDNTLLLSGNAAVTAAGLAISHVADYISFASGCTATLTVTGKVLSDYQAWVSTGHIRVDGVKQANFNEFKVVGNTLSLEPRPTKLAFGIQPSNLASGSAGLPITPAVTVLLQDAAGNTVTTATSSVTISSGTTAFTPGSVLTVNAVNGVATFASIAPTTNGTHTLTASSGSLTPATSSPFLVGPETLTDWYNWSGTQSLDHDRTVTRYIAIGYGSPATLNHTAGTLYHVNTAGDWFVIGNNVAGTYNMSGNAAANAADGTGRFRLGNNLGQGTMTMTDNATATVGSLEFAGLGADTLLLSGSASMHATGLTISSTADSISFASGCAATLTVTGKVLSDYQAWVGTGHIRVDGVKQANFNEFKVVGNTLSLVPPPTKLAFGVQPSNPGAGSAGLPITPAVTVLLQDAAGNTVTNGTSSVTISSGTTAFTPGSVLTVNAVNGVATFAAISPTTNGTHTLTASSGSLTPATSNPFLVGPETLTDWYDWSGTQSLDHDRTVTRYIAIGYGNPATLNHTAGTLYHSYTGDWFVIGNNVAGTYNMSGNAAVNAADGTGRFRLGNNIGQGTMTMTDNATATVGSLEFAGFGADTLLLSGSASMQATGLTISGTADYISFASGCAATLTVTGKVLSDYQAWVGAGYIRVDGVKQANFNSFKLVGNTLSLMPPPTKLAFGVQPSNPGAGSAGLPITPAVTVLLQDAAGNTVTYATSSVTISSGTTAFTPGSVLTVNAVNGVATFAAIAPTTNGTHTLTASSGSLTPATSSPFPVGPDTLIDWYDWSGTQSLNHDRTVTRFLAIGWGHSATLNHTAGTLYHSFSGDWFVIGNNVAGTYNLSGNAAVNAADGTGRFRLGNEGGQGTMTMTDSATATVGSLEFGGFFGDNTLLLSGNAAVNAAGLAISHVADYISFASGCTATLTVTGKVLSDYQAWVSAGHIRVDGAVQADFGKFKVAGNTLSLATGAANNYAGWLAANPEAAGQAADQDHDNDGVPNGVECFLGGTANTTGFTHLPGVVNTAGTRSVTWTKGSGYSGAYGTDYVVEVSDTLQNWANAPTDHVTESPASVKYTFPFGPQQFARLKVVVP